MQAPIAIALRGSVLLGCLIVLPLLAAGGLNVPTKLISSVQVWLPQQSLGNPLLVSRTIQVELPADALRYRHAGNLSEDSLEDENLLATAEVMPASYEEIESPTAHSLRTSDALVHLQPGESSHLTEVSPARLSEEANPFEMGAVSLPDANFPATVPAAAGFSNEEPLSRAGSSSLSVEPSAAAVETRLRELGAIDVRLEPWGNGAIFYRYCAVLAVAGSADVQRHFQAIGSDPHQIAKEVLAQVETWAAR